MFKHPGWKIQLLTACEGPIWAKEGGGGFFPENRGTRKKERQGRKKRGERLLKTHEMGKSFGSEGEKIFPKGERKG